MSKSRCILSVVIPFYNPERHIDACLDSLKKSIVEGVEVIFINDGSTDSTVNKIITSMQSEGFHWCLLEQENRGVSAARNLGLLNARGEYVYFLDADDRIVNDGLKKITSLLSIRNFQICCFGFDKIDENSEVISSFDSRYSFPHDGISSTRFAKSVFGLEFDFCTGSVVFQREFLLENNIKFNESISRNEDRHFFFQAIVHSSNTIFLREVLLHYLQHSSSTTHEAILNFEASETLLQICRDLQQRGISGFETELYGGLLPKSIGSAISRYLTHRDSDAIAIEKKYMNLLAGAKLKYFSKHMKAYLAIKIMKISVPIYTRILHRLPKKNIGWN